MKTRLAGMLAAAFLITGATAYADETIPEKGKATSKDVKRQGRKAVHRTEEALCTGTKAECAKEKAKNRVDEGTEAVKDEADELKQKAD